MIKNYLKIALRNIFRNKIYSFINIFGLAVGMACFVLVILYIRYEFSYESFHKNADNIYRVNVVHNHPKGVYRLSHSMVPLGKTLITELPEVKGFTRIEDFGRSLVTYKNKKFYETNMILADQGIFDLFTIPVLNGDMNSALSKKYSIVLSKSAALKYFGDENPVGQTLLIDNEMSLTVSAIIKDFPENTHLSADFIISYNTLSEEFGEDFMNNWVTTRLMTYILLPDNPNLRYLERKITDVMNAHSSTEVTRSLELEQFSRIHLYSDVSMYGNINNIYLFLAIGILILLIASINFMNLSTARSSRRANEVGLRKVVGANYLQLIRQFLGESIIISFVAMVMALLIVNIILPIFKNLTEQALEFPALTDWNFYGLLLLITLIVGIISGSYPAFYLSGFKPVNILKGKQISGRKNRNLRRILVVIQFSIAIVLIISTLSIRDQLAYMLNTGLGFQKKQIVVLPLIGGEFENDIESFKHALMTNSNIKAVSGSRLLPSKIGMYNNVTWEGAGENETIALIQNKVDYDFMDLYEIEIIKGRNFSADYATDLLDYRREGLAGAILLNEEAVKRFGWKDPIGKKVIQTFGTQRYYFNVVGVFKNFHFSSLHNKIEPLNLFLRPAYPRKISIKIEPNDVQNTIAHIRNTWNNFNPMYPFEYYFLDETYSRYYQSEEKLQTLFSYFSLLGIFISCLGLFGLASFAAERRTKEIGVRKVLGASISNIIMILTKEFTKWILIANLIAWPLAWIYVNSWLDDFAYRIEINWWVFLFAGGIAFFIAVITVSSQAIRAAISNPATSLRYE